MLRPKIYLAVVLMNLVMASVYSQDVSSRYTELLDYVQEAPDQGRTASCLFVASTGAMELIANKKAGIKNPMPYGKYDLAESFLIHAPLYLRRRKNFMEKIILKFNYGYGIHVDDWPYNAWEGTEVSSSVWDHRNWAELPKVELPKVETIPLFQIGKKWDTNVLGFEHIQRIKDALRKHRSPIMVSYNDNSYWHVVLIVGFDDELPGNCYQITEQECKTSSGSFYVRDSFGRATEVRDYDWFRVRGNAAIVVKEKE